MQRYRWTPAMTDVPFLFGAAGATTLVGPALLHLLEGIGHPARPARHLLTRMRDIGALDVERRGRMNVYQIAASSLARYQEVEGTRPAPPWTGVFDGILYNIPETQRSARDRFLHLCHSAGYGLLRAGVLIAPTDRWDRVRLASADIGVESWTIRVAIRPTNAGDARLMATRAWDLEAIATSYRSSLELVQAAAARTADPHDAWEVVGGRAGARPSPATGTAPRALASSGVPPGTGRTESAHRRSAAGVPA
jgi:DNA-binding transcriptional regulator PaaX